MFNLTRSREGVKNDQPFTKAHYPLTIMALIRPGCTSSRGSNYKEHKAHKVRTREICGSIQQDDYGNLLPARGH
ncbi:MAG: hypothetical protein LUO89_13655 [Methanothrix sp.]|nr:hypothetical protein [Methanothrix sp.]